MSAFQKLTARLIRAESLSAYTKHLEFEVAPARRFGFVAGQWLSLTAAKPDQEEITRAYSIASAPGEDNRFALCLNRVQDGFMSNFLCDMAGGDEIQCQGPFGDFILRPPMRDTIFIATGTGIAPFRSMLHWQLASQHENFHYLPTLSRGSAEWQGLRGYVQDHLASIASDRSDMHAYVCGLDKMVKANRDLLKSLGWDRKSILYEKYD
jgi:ferredoxin-NADP reductase